MTGLDLFGEHNDGENNVDDHKDGSLTYFLKQIIICDSPSHTSSVPGQDFSILQSLGWKMLKTFTFQQKMEPWVLGTYGQLGTLT